MQANKQPLTAKVMLQGQSAFLAGVTWEPVPLRYRRNIRSWARRQGADSVVSYPYPDSEGKPQWLAGLVNQSALSLPKTVKNVYSLGLLIAPQLARSGYGIIAVGDNEFAFVSCIERVLLNDVVGDRDAVEQARQTFLEFNAEPSDGWWVFAPADWHIAGANTFDLDALLEGRTLSSSARFQTTSARRQVLALAVVGLMALSGAYGWIAYRDHHDALAQEAARRAVQAQQEQVHADAAVTPPWENSPAMMAFVSACAARWQAAPLSLAGWVFKEAQCIQDGSIRFAYGKPAGVAVADFAGRVREVYNGAVTPYFNLPGDGDLGGFSETVAVEVTPDPRPLPDAQTQIQRVTTFAQRMRLQLDLQVEDNRHVSPAGEERLLPWRIFTLSLETAIPPQTLLSHLDDVGIRINSITVALERGRLTYKIEGKVYATP